MPDKRRHRGAHPMDATLFRREQMPRLRAAVGDLSWLMGRNYASKAALALVGDHYQLQERQRSCVLRASAADVAVAARQSRLVSPEALPHSALHLDGYNVLITIESALAGGIVLYGRDGCLRDIASMHGTFRRVEETEAALQLCGQALRELGVIEAVWYLDAPVSNSGRLKTLIEEVSRTNHWPCRAEVVMNPDNVLKESQAIVASADGIILDADVRWFNFGRYVVERYAPREDMLDFQSVLTNVPQPNLDDLPPPDAVYSVPS